MEKRDVQFSAIHALQSRFLYPFFFRRQKVHEAVQMYAEGADYVLMPRLLAAQHLLPIIALCLQGDTEGMAQLKQAHLDHLQTREEIVS